MDVSVVIPLFNKGPYIARAVQSVLRQTMSPREIVIVDDGSTDDGPAVIRTIGDSRIRLIQQSNAGVSAARNNGIAACESPWVALLDADDEWKPEFLRSVSKIVDRRGDLVCVGTDFTNDQGVPLIGRVDLNDGILEDFFELSLQRGLPVLCSSAVVVRREALLSAGGFPVGCRSMEDTDTWMRLAWTGSIGFVSESLAIYHLDVPESASKQNRRSPQLPIMIETHEAWLDAGRIPSHLRESSANFARDWLFRFVRHLIFHGRGDEARATLRRFNRLCEGDLATTRRLIARSRVPQAIPSLSRRIKSILGVYRQPQFF
jgi:glycosyltransferase involved in cell wall biosynthesis